MRLTYSFLLLYSLFLFNFGNRLWSMEDPLLNDDSRCIPCPIFATGFTGTVVNFCNVRADLLCAVTANIEDTLFVCGKQTNAGPVNIINTTESFSCTSGALTVSGGVGIQGNLIVCGAISGTGGFAVTGPQLILDPTQSTNCSNGALAVPFGGVGIGGNLNVCGTGHFFNTGASTSCTNGALIVDGGVGIGGNLNVCGVEHIFNTTKSTSCTNGALVIDGGVGIVGDLNVCGKINAASGFTGPVVINNTTQSTACTNGALTVSGGVGIGGNLNVCGTINVLGGFTGPVTINNTTQSTACTNGALTVSGGVGIGGNLNVCGSGTIAGPVIINNTTQSTACTNGALTVSGGVGIGGNLNVCGTINTIGGFTGPVNINNTTQSTACTNGALVVSGGVGVVGNLNVCGSGSFGGPVTINNTTQSTACTNGALTVSGGVGVGGNLNVCGTVTASGFSGPIIPANFAFIYSSGVNQPATTSFSQASFNTVQLSNGWILSGAINLTNPQSGLYFVEYTGLWNVDANTESGIAMRATLNAAEVAGSYTSGFLTSTSNVNNIQGLTHGFLMNYTGGDVLNMEYTSSLAAGAVLASNGFGGASVKPSITITITRVA